MERVLDGVGKGQRGHTDCLPEGQRYAKVAREAYYPHYDRCYGVFTRVKGR